jgi:WD40 repeat protein
VRGGNNADRQVGGKITAAAITLAGVAAGPVFTAIHLPACASTTFVQAARSTSIQDEAAAVRRAAGPASTGELPASRGGAPIGRFGQYPKKLAFSPDSKVLATSGNDGAARLWDVASRRQTGVIKVSGAHVLGVAFSPDGKILATADSDGTARLWKVATRRQFRVIKVGSENVLGVAFSPDGKLLATAGQGGSARLWHVAAGRQVGAAMTPGADSPSQQRPSRVTAVTFSPDGKTLATDTEFKAQLWNVATHQQTGRPLGAVGAANGVFSLSFSPDSKILATVGNPTIRLWNVATHQRIGTAMSAGQTAGYGVAFSPAGKVLVTTDTSGVIRLWNVATQQRIGTQIKPKGRHEFLLEALSPNGNILATTQFDGPAQLWHLNLTSRT